MTQRLADIGLDATVAGAPGFTIRRADQGASTPRLPVLSVDFAADGSEGKVDASLELLGVLGEGGMGRVYLAREHALDRDVAVKTVKPGASGGARRAILAEGRVTGRLEHPAIVPVHALGVDTKGNPALVMKRIEGVAWEQLIEDPAHPGWAGWDGTPDDRIAGHLQIAMIVCNAVHYAHSRGYLHCDIKPDNVLIGTFGDVYLADWGVAGEVGESDPALRGTLAFMAPEMALGTRIDAQTDVYLLGATLHMALTGKPLHQGTTLGDLVAAAAASVPPELAGVPEELAEVVRRACHREHERRFATAEELRDALRDFRKHEDSHALAHEAEERLARVVAIAGLDEPTEAELRELDEAIAQAQFGVEQAARIWPDNPTAARSRTALRKVVEERRARRAALERLDREHNPDIGAEGA